MSIPIIIHFLHINRITASNYFERINTKLPEVHTEEMDETLRQKDYPGKNKMKEHTGAR